MTAHAGGMASGQGSPAICAAPAGVPEGVDTREREVHAMRKLAMLVVAIAGAGLLLAGVSLARGDNDKGRSGTRLSGYEETPAISTDGRGTFEARIDSSSIQFKLRYRNLEGGAVSGAHIHLGQRHTAGGVMAFLCGGGGKPACPAGADVTVEGAITSANVLALPAQGIAAGEFDELVDAIRAGAAYVNVHTATYANGEIRGQLGKGNRGKGGDKDKDD